MLGDLNARVGDEIIPGIKNRFNENDINDNGEILIQFCALNEFPSNRENIFSLAICHNEDKM